MKISALILALSIAPAFAPTIVSAQESMMSRGMLTVTGTHTQVLENTSAQISFGVETQALSSAEAVQTNNALLTEVFTSMTAAGVDQADIETRDISLRQVTDPKTRAITGYTMSNNVDVHIHDIAILDDVLTAATNAGINRIDRVSMVPAKSATDNNMLRAMAAKDAQEKALIYANSLNLTITGIISVSEDTNHGSPMPMARFAQAESLSMPIAAGKTDNSMSVTVVYEVELKQ